MNNRPEGIPDELENPPPPEPELTLAPLTQSSGQPVPEKLSQEFTPFPDEPPTEDQQPLFQNFIRPTLPPQERIPNFGHLVILGLVALGGLFVAGLIASLAVHFHVLGVSTMDRAAGDIRYTLGTEGLFYLITFLICVVLFPLLWHKGFFTGLHWRGSIAFQRSGYLTAIAVVCFVLAVISGVLWPGPDDAPIDRMFRLPGAAWMLFGFGITVAPFFEEIAFRGFLLPALCSAFDWAAEKANDQAPPPNDECGHPEWSTPAMVISAIVTSLLFALLHAEQNGRSWGPFLLLCSVSLVLCWVRLGMRSLAASVLVHASYNFFLFSMMLVGTGGFRHLDRM